MYFCPECGGDVELLRSDNDVATIHRTHACLGCGMEWEETVTKARGGLISINPSRVVDDDDEEEVTG